MKQIVLVISCRVQIEGSLLTMFNTVISVDFTANQQAADRAGQAP